MSGGNLGGFNYDAGESGSYVDSAGVPHIVITGGASRPSSSGNAGKEGGSMVNAINTYSLTADKGKLLIDIPNHGYGNTICSWESFPKSSLVVYKIDFYNKTQGLARIYNGDVTNPGIAFPHPAGATPHTLSNLRPIAQEIVKNVSDFRNDLTFVANVLNQFGQRFGQKLEDASKELSRLSLGQTIRSRDEALAAFNQYQSNIVNKFGSADLHAIANAIESVDKAQMAQQLKAWGRYFGYASDAISVEAIGEGVYKGITTGDWGDAFSATESAIQGKIVGVAVAYAFSAAAVSGVGILGFALLYGLAAAFINQNTLNTMLNVFNGF